ncbi:MULTISPECIES: hypothetical protein [Thermodesulfovibrio]|jgi:hypothetical protein|uniref:hypothetical protein n=1 Tax=Thermodesulfovibrio TaxID=28261 RepID=UPI00260EBA96|nr:hypothetical protein [Thermodesulfovibrio sp.]
MNKQRILSYISICNIHSERLKSSLRNLEKLIPLSVLQYKLLNEQELSFLDQMSYRFGKLQDLSGRLLRAILLTIEEDVSHLPFIDILNKAEKLGIIDSAHDWITLRELRNLLTQEYSEKIEEIVNGINKLYEISKRLLDIYKGIIQYINKRQILE